MPSRAEGLTCWTACASTCAAECRRTDEAVGRVERDGLDARAVRERRGEVREHAVHPGDDDIATVGEQGGGTRRSLEVVDDTIDGDADLGHGTPSAGRLSRCYRSPTRPEDSGAATATRPMASPRE